MRMSIITSVLTISLVVPRDIFDGLAHEREIMFEMVLWNVKFSRRT